MAEGVPPELDQRINELKNAIYFLSEQVGKANAPPGLEKIEPMGVKVDELSARVDKLSDSLGWVARQSSELSTLLKALEGRLNNVPAKEDVTAISRKLDSMPRPEQIHEVGEHVDKLADSMGWVARQSGELPTAMNALNQKLDGLPTKDQFASWARNVTTATETSGAEMVSKVDSMRDRLKALDSLSESFGVMSKQNLQVSQNIEAIAKRTSETASRIEGLPTSDQMGQFAGMVEARLGEVSEGVTKNFESKLSQSMQRVEQQLAAASEDFKASGARMDASSQRMNEQITAAVNELKELKNLDTKVDALAEATKDLSARVDGIPTREQMGQFASMVESKLTEVSANVSGELNTRLSQTTQDIGSTLTEAVTQFRENSAAANAKLDLIVASVDRQFSQSSGKLDARLNEAMAELQQISKNVDTKMDSTVAEVEKQFDTVSTRLDSRLNEAMGELQGVSAKVDMKFAETATRLDERLNQTMGELQGVSAKLDSKFAETATRLDSKLSDSASSVEAKLNEASERLDRDLADSSAKAAAQISAALGDIKAISESIDARLTPLESLQNTVTRFASDYERTAASFEESHRQFEFQKQQVQSLSEALAVIHRDLNHESEGVDAINTRINALGEALTAIGAATTDTAAKLSSLEASTAQSARTLEQLTPQLQAVFPKLESLAQITTSENVALGDIRDSLDRNVQELGQASKEAATTLGEKLEMAVRELGNRTQSFEQKLADLSGRLEKVASVTSLAEKEEGEVLAALRDMGAQFETQRSQGNMISTSIDALGEQVKEVEVGSQNLAGLLEKQRESQASELNKSAQELVALRRDLEEQSRETRLVVDALTDLVKEFAHMEGELEKNKVDPTKLYEDMEKKFLAKLSAKLSG